MPLSKIRILGIDYTVNYCDMRKQHGRTDVGAVDPLGCAIVIDSSLNSEAHGKSVLLHEILEALDYRLELGLDHKVITQLEAGLFQVIRDNPELIPLLGGEG